MINAVYHFSQNIGDYQLIEIFPTIEEAREFAKKLEPVMNKKIIACQQSLVDFTKTNGEAFAKMVQENEASNAA